jgi:hypothetical protein
MDRIENEKYGYITTTTITKSSHELPLYDMENMKKKNRRYTQEDMSK